MSFGKEEFERKVIPIWDSSRMAASLAENSSTKKVSHATIINACSPRLIEELSISQDIGVAVELLNASKVEGNREGIIIASKRILDSFDLPKPVVDMARAALSEEAGALSLMIDSRGRLYTLRSVLRNNPRNTLAWVDMAREYLVLGYGKPAARAMSIALALAPANRWITRVASRLHIHLKDFDKSFSILSRHPGIKHDPWIASAELAVCQLLGRTSKNISSSKRLLEQKLHPSHTVELASSLGTMEIESGAIKKAKMYIRASLEHPNRNSLAQAVWAEQAHDIKLASHLDVQQLDIAYEAKAWECYIRGDIPAALENCLAWYDSEPYSSQPSMLASYLAAIDDRYDDIIAIANKGLITSPSNPTLKMNKAYAELAKVDPLNPTQKDIENIAVWLPLFKEHQKGDRYHAAQSLANIGMLCYRFGELEKGREYYELAERICSAERFNTQLMCMIYHAREAMLAQAGWANELLEKARVFGGKNVDPGKVAAFGYLEKLNFIEKNPGSYRAVLKIGKAPDQKKPDIFDRMQFAKAIGEGLIFSLPDDFSR
ncbi:tetratricopeptide repeat protein [Pseudomonas kurunegalensis]|uniref:tetratricopeptide repeat protein n=1 Tax=Pseudomonas kurunegalensis TaxID=485880 RepID=UPI003555FA44